MQRVVTRGGWVWCHQFVCGCIEAIHFPNFSNFCFVVLQWATHEECVTYTWWRMPNLLWVANAYTSLIWRARPYFWRQEKAAVPFCVGFVPLCLWIIEGPKRANVPLCDQNTPQMSHFFEKLVPFCYFGKCVTGTVAGMQQFPTRWHCEITVHSWIWATPTHKNLSIYLMSCMSVHASEHYPCSTAVTYMNHWTVPLE